MDLALQPSLGGAVLATLAVAGGAPLFGLGLRTLRLRRNLARLTERPLSELPSGFVQVRGRVALDSPLFGPLSGKPCAGFRLEVGGAGQGSIAAVEQRRHFRLAAEGTMAHVSAGEGRWDLGITERREFQTGQPLTENLTALLARIPEAQWLRRCGTTLTLTERSLLAGQECWVIGQARHARPFELATELEQARTGTDSRSWATTIPSGEPDAPGWTRALGEPELWIDGGGHLEFVRVSQAAPRPRDLAPSRLPSLGLAAGPLLTLAGLLYLAHVADWLSAHRRF